MPPIRPVGSQAPLSRIQASRVPAPDLTGRTQPALYVLRVGPASLDETPGGDWTHRLHHL